jgi:hypothetical protein
MYLNIKIVVIKVPVDGPPTGARRGFGMRRGRVG